MPATNERQRRVTELGTEVVCAKCEEFWPEDSEFYFMHGGKAHSWCKACYRADEKVQAKTERWREKQRKGAAPPAPEPVDWSQLSRALRPMVAAPQAGFFTGIIS